MPSPDILRLTTTEDGRFRLEIDIVVDDLGQATRLLQEIDATRRISPFVNSLPTAAQRSSTPPTPVAIDAAALLRLAQAYAAATGLALRTVGRRVFGVTNDRFFIRIAEGKGVHSRSLEKASAWFASNWPKTADWPSDVPGGPLASVPPRHRSRRTGNVPIRGDAHPLRRYRARHNMTSEDLAALLSCSAALISKIEARKRALSSSMLRKILERTQGELTAEELLGRKPDEGDTPT